MRRKTHFFSLTLFLPAIIAVLFVASSTAFGAAKVVLVNMDKPGVGLNDRTPAAPVNGNKGATVGEQRRIAVQYALDIWGAALDSSVDIRVQVKFEPLPCSERFGVAGSAGAIQGIHDFPGAEFPNTWYLIALANYRVVWDGAHVKAAVPNVLSRGMPKLTVNSPGDIDGSYVVDGAEFDPPLSTPSVTGNVVLADDGNGVLTDACSPLRNAQAIRGNIALVDRGSCNFTDKVKNAQDAGAIGVIVVNNVSSHPFKMAGNGEKFAIRSVMIRLGEGNRIKAVLKSMSVNATLGVDMTVFTGADSSGRALLYAPNPIEEDVSIGHWDPVAFPDQMMENFVPEYNLSVKEPQDLTMALMRDIGWVRKTGSETGHHVTTVSAADYSDRLAGQSIAAAFGIRLATTTSKVPEGYLLPTELAGTKVMLKDKWGNERAAPLFFVSPNQINYYIHPEISWGPVAVTVTSGDGSVSVGTAQVERVAQAIFTANNDGKGVPLAEIWRAKADGKISIELVFQYDSAQRRFVSRPIDLGEATDKVYLVLYGTGLRHHQGLS